MGRRSFIRGCIAVLVAVQIPASVVTTLCGDELTGDYCIKKLSTLWWAEQARTERRFKTVNFECGKQFYEAFEGQLMACQRFGNAPVEEPRWLAFKSGRVTVTGNGWYVKVVN